MFHILADLGPGPAGIAYAPLAHLRQALTSASIGS